MFAMAQDVINELRVITSPEQSLAARIAMIDSASESIVVSVYIFGEDLSSLYVLQKLKGAAQRGVNVRVIIDGLNNHIPGNIMGHLMETGVNFRIYNPVRFRFPLRRNLARMHDKVILTDNRHFLTGGRNIKDAYYGLDDRNFRDRDIYISGPLAGDVKIYLDSLWANPVLKEPKIRKNHRKCFQTAARQLRDAALEFDNMNAAPEKPLVEFMLTEDDNKFIADVHGGAGKIEKVTTEKVYATLAAAQYRIMIETPYLVVDDVFLDLLTELRSRDVNITIITNSLATTDVVIAHGAYLHTKRKLLQLGIHIYEYYSANEMFHSKTFLIDSSIVLAGSYNFDNLSRYTISESMVRVNDKAVAAFIEFLMAENMAHSMKINPETHRPEGSVLRHPESGFSRLFLLKITEWFIAPLLKRFL